MSRSYKSVFSGATELNLWDIELKLSDRKNTLQKSFLITSSVVAWKYCR